MMKKRKIVHICMTGPYQDGMGYDENIMPKYHREMGFDVTVISCFDETAGSRNRYDDGNVHICRLPEGHSWGKLSQFGEYDGLYDELVRIDPEIIYVHNAQFIGFFEVIKYCRKNRDTKLFVDNHADYYNSPIHGVKLIILNYIIYRIMFLLSCRYVSVFWGVTPWRCVYLNKVFGVPKRKIRLLVMGADDDNIRISEKDSIRSEMRKKYGIEDKDFLIVSGGKIIKEKRIHHLIKAVAESDNPDLKLIVFGEMDDYVSSKVKKFLNDPRIHCVGWIDSGKVYDYFLSADIAIFPGTHSILWEQACAAGIPVAVKRWKYMDHVDIGGNAFFLEMGNVKDIRSLITSLTEDESKYKKALAVAQEKCIDYFSYSRISRAAIGYDISTEKE